VTDSDPVPPSDDGLPSWLKPLQVAMGTLFLLGAVITGLSGSNLFVLVAFGIDAVIVVWLMQQPWAKKLLQRRE
jgi:hypothetical protein